jgi:TolA-binding protein
MNRIKIILIFLFFSLFVFKVSSQVTFTSEEINSEFNRGMEFFNKEKYPAAIRSFDAFVRTNSGDDPVKVAEAEYFSAFAALKLFNADGEYRMTRFIALHPGSHRINDAYMALGDYGYSNRNYRKSLTWYEKVNRQFLKGEELPEYFFRLGYSHYMRGDKSRALLMFSEIKDIDTEYTPPAIYYFSHIAYEEKKYHTALDGFNRLKDDETFGPVVPFYIVQILYLRKDYDGILEIAPDLLERAGKERAVELYRFIGDAWYNKGNYKEAVTYLEDYTKGVKASGREDKFQLGYCYYKTGELDKAIKLFLEIGAKPDLLSQNIWNILGDCYLQKDDKKRAQLAFGEASKLDFDKSIKEESLFNYAKLTYETSNSPFGEAIAAFQEYIDLYPGSERIGEAYNYLVATFLQIKNYKAALDALDKIRNKDIRLEEAYQRVAFFRGLELFRNMEIEPSIDMFDKSLKYQKYNRQIRSRALYWRGEARYRLKDYSGALEDYREFMSIPGAASLSEYNMVRYNIGYAHYNLQEYDNALNSFTSFESGVTNVKPDVLADAKNRIADCYFVSTSYPMAISYYDKVIEYGMTDADYAMFQKGFAQGLMNDSKGKISTLTALTVKYPSSLYVPNAIFERGRAYVVLNDFTRGEADFNTIIKTYQNSPFVPRAVLQLGLLYYNRGENEKAVEQYKKVVENFKLTPEARFAMTGLKNAYVDMNDVEAYFSYVKSLDGYGDVSSTERDSLLYASGENLYISGRCDRASEMFRNYLKEFGNGSFRLNAMFYLAECSKASGNKDEALALYRDVIKIPNNQFMESALIAASAILYEKENYTEALVYYEELERITEIPENVLISLKGQLRSAYLSGDAQKTIAAASRISGKPGIPEEFIREANYMRAKAHFSLGEDDEALDSFRKTASEVTSAEGAESKYMVAELLNKKGRTEEAEKVISEFIGKNTPHQFWMAKVFLLLADISIKKGDNLQARATLQSLKEYYTKTDDGILEEVKTKLDSLNQGKESEPDSVRINLNPSQKL